MRKLFGYSLVLPILGLTILLAQTKMPPTQAKTPPMKLVFPAKTGNVTFDHSAHVKREKNNCSVCHPSLFAQDAKKPVGFKPPHRNEEDKKVSCGSCHRAGGTAFETKGNCTNSKCHVRPSAKKE